MQDEKAFVHNQTDW